MTATHLGGSAECSGVKEAQDAEAEVVRKEASEVCSCFGHLCLQHMVRSAEVLLGADGEETLEEAPPFGLRPAFKLQRANKYIAI